MLAKPGVYYLVYCQKPGRSYGLDRQFRGEIRALQIYGSRISHRGALELQQITRHMDQ